MKFAFPTSPLVDASGIIRPAWRAFLQRLTGDGTISAVVTGGELAAETTRATNTEAALQVQISTLASVSGGVRAGISRVGPATGSLTAYFSPAFDNNLLLFTFLPAQAVELGAQPPASTVHIASVTRFDRFGVIVSVTDGTSALAVGYAASWYAVGN